MQREPQVIERTPEYYKGVGVPTRFKDARKKDFAFEIPWDNNLFIHGPSGTGKTHLLCALAISIVSAIYVPADDIIARIKRSFDHRDEHETDIIEEYRKARCLIIDDVGATRITDWSASVFHMILDKRYGDESHTIVSSNYDLDSLSSLIDPRTCRRLSDMCKIIEMR